MERRTGTSRWARALVLAALAAGGAGCGEGAAAPDAVEIPARAVAVETVAPRPVEPAVRVPGVVEAKARIELAFRVAGFVERFHVEEGDRVEAGALLAELDDGELARGVRAAAAALERAAAEAADTERTFRRQEALLARGSTSQQAFDRAGSAWEMARAARAEARVAVDEARDRLAKARLRAPVDAVIERRLLEPHERATPQTPVLVLAVLDTVTVRAALPDVHAVGLARGGPAAVRAVAWPDRRFDGRIARIDVAADAATRTVPFEVELANPDLALRPQMAVEVEVPTGEAREAVLVPLAAVLRDADRTPFCFLLQEAGDGPRALRRAVRIGTLHGDRVEVLSGLAPGERLIVRGQHFLRPDDPVRLAAGD